MSDIEFTLSVNGTQFTVEMKKAGDVLRQLGFTSEKSSKSVSKIEETVSAVVQRLSSLRVATAGAAKNNRLRHLLYFPETQLNFIQRDINASGYISSHKFSRRADINDGLTLFHLYHFVFFNSVV